jgi:DNA mismatch repair protein MutS
MEVLEQGENIVFLRKLKEGPAAESYGIHVAMLAGLSQNVLQRAEQIMALLKERDADLSKTFESKHIAVNQSMNDVNKKPDRFEQLLKDIDPQQMTPLEALNILCQWKKLLETGIDFPEPKRNQQKEKRNKNENNTLSLFD